MTQRTNYETAYECPVQMAQHNRKLCYLEPKYYGAQPLRGWCLPTSDLGCDTDKYVVDQQRRIGCLVTLCTRPGLLYR